MVSTTSKGGPGAPCQARVGKFIGYARPNLKAFRFLFPPGSIIISIDVHFDESTSPASDKQVDELAVVSLALVQYRYFSSDSAYPSHIKAQSQFSPPTPAPTPIVPIGHRVVDLQLVL
jgi:hypothetical protein